MIEFIAKGKEGILSIGVGHLPMRKSECVTVNRGSTTYVVAYCRNGKEAQRLRQALADILNLELPKDPDEVQAADTISEEESDANQ